MKKDRDNDIVDFSQHILQWIEARGNIEYSVAMNALTIIMFTITRRAKISPEEFEEGCAAMAKYYREVLAVIEEEKQ